MNKMKVPTRDELSPEGQEIFDLLIKKIGKVPNLFAAIGYSVPALKGFLDFDATLSNGMFSAKERKAVALVVAEVNQCRYCLAAHTAAALLRGFSKEQTIAIRKAESDDARLKATLQLARSIAENKGHVDEVLIDRFYANGFKESALIELISLVTLRIFTNYAFAIAGVPLDFPEAPPLA